MPNAKHLRAKEASTKEASGILVYLVEELGDARLRANQLKQYVAKALEVVNESEQKDHIYEVAADYLHGIPDTLFKLEKALDAAAMAASRMDYEEIKQGLKPEKAEELERVLEDVRLQYLKRRSDPMSAKKAADVMDALATAIDATGEVPTEELAGLIAEVEETEGQGGQKQARRKDPADFFRQAAEYVRTTRNPDMKSLIASMRRVLADSLVEAGAGEEFQKVNPKITDEEVEEINEMHEKNKDVVKEKAKKANLDLESPSNITAQAKFEAAFEAAKFARMGAHQGKSRKAAFFGLNAIQTLAEALAILSPDYDDKFSMIANRVSQMRMAVVSDAARTDVLGGGGDEEMMAVFAADDAEEQEEAQQQKAQQQKQAGRYGPYTRRRVG